MSIDRWVDFLKCEIDTDIDIDTDTYNVFFKLHTMRCYSAIKKEGNPAIYNNMDKTWGHYIKWNKSDIERQILYDLICGN